MKKTVIAVLLTVLLGPGVGHLYLRKYKRGTLLIVSSLFFAAHLAWRVAKSLSQFAPQLDPVKQDPNLLMQNFALAYPKTMFVYDAIFAAIWAYAIVDAYFQARAMIVPPPAENIEQEM